MGSSLKTFAVVGSNCFTGSHIVDRLLEDPEHRVIGLSRSPEKAALFLPYRRHSPERFQFFQVDMVREPQRLMQVLDHYRPAHVINVAALSEVYQSHLTPNEYFAVNTAAVVRLVNELRNRTWLERYVHISSAEVYGNCSAAVTETAAVNPSTPYAASKAAADLYLATVHRHFGFPASIVRSTNVYGRHQQLYKIIPRTMIYLRLGRMIDLHGGGKTIRPFIHIRDVVDGVCRILAHPAPSLTYHFSGEEMDCIADVVDKICRRMGFQFGEVTRTAGNRAEQDRCYWLDTALARQELGWRPTTSFDEGLEEVRLWIEAHWDKILREPLEYVHLVEYRDKAAGSARNEKSISPLC